LTASRQGEEQRGFNVWDGQTILGRVYLAEDGKPAWDVALDPIIRAVLADDQGASGTLHAELAQAAPHAALRRLAHLAARKVGPSAFYFPEGANPNRVDLHDDEAALALSLRLTRESGVLTVVHDCQGDWDEGRRRECIPNKRG